MLSESSAGGNSSGMLSRYTSLLSQQLLESRKDMGDFRDNGLETQTKPLISNLYSEKQTIKDARLALKEEDTIIYRPFHASQLALRSLKKVDRSNFNFDLELSGDKLSKPEVHCGNGVKNEEKDSTSCETPSPMNTHKARRHVLINAGKDIKTSDKSLSYTSDAKDGLFDKGKPTYSNFPDLVYPSVSKCESIKGKHDFVNGDKIDDYRQFAKSVESPHYLDWAKKHISDETFNSLKKTSSRSDLNCSTSTVTELQDRDTFHSESHSQRQLKEHSEDSSFSHTRAEPKGQPEVSNFSYSQAEPKGQPEVPRFSFSKAETKGQPEVSNFSFSQAEPKGQPEFSSFSYLRAEPKGQPEVPSFSFSKAETKGQPKVSSFSYSKAEPKGQPQVSSFSHARAEPKGQPDVSSFSNARTQSKGQMEKPSFSQSNNFKQSDHNLPFDEFKKGLLSNVTDLNYTKSVNSCHSSEKNYFLTSSKELSHQKGLSLIANKQPNGKGSHSNSSEFSAKRDEGLTSHKQTNEKGSFLTSNEISDEQANCPKQLKKMNRQLRSEKEILAREVVALRERLDELEGGYPSSISTYIPNNEHALLKKINDLECQIEDLQEANEDVTMKLYSAEQKLEDLTNENRSFRSLQNIINDLEKENHLLKERLLSYQPNERQKTTLDRARSIHGTNSLTDKEEERADFTSYPSTYSDNLEDSDLSETGTEYLLSDEVQNYMYNGTGSGRLATRPPVQSSSRQGRSRHRSDWSKHTDLVSLKHRSRSLDTGEMVGRQSRNSHITTLSVSHISNPEEEGSSKDHTSSSYLGQSRGFRSVTPTPINTQSCRSNSIRNVSRYSVAGLKPFVPRSASDIEIGDLVKFSRQGGKISLGLVKYVGHLHGRKDIYLGVELDKEGKHDGVFDGVRYFQCNGNRAVFVSFGKVVMAWCQQERDV